GRMNRSTRCARLPDRVRSRPRVAPRSFQDRKLHASARLSSPLPEGATMARSVEYLIMPISELDRYYPQYATWVQDLDFDDPALAEGVICRAFDEHDFQLGHLVIDANGKILVVEVEREHRRQGIATGMYEELLAAGYRVEHDWDNMRDDGAAWAKSLPVHGTASRTPYAGRLLVYDRETHLEPDAALAVGDLVEIVRGNGPREGARMGEATVTGFANDGSLILDVRV